MKLSSRVRILIASIFICFSWINPVLGETLDVTAIRPYAGSSISKQPLDVLSRMELSGAQDNWSSYIEASPGKKRFAAVFSFRTKQKKNWDSIQLDVNTIGEAARSQKWIFKLRDFKNKKWVTIGNNKKAQDWKWHHQLLTVNKNVANYLSRNGAIRVLYWSNNNLDVSNIDLMRIHLSEASNQDWWKPSPQENLSWQWQINGRLNTDIDVDMFDVDLFDTPKQTIQSLKDAGKIVVCYFSAGTYEGWREDWKQFFPFIQGDHYTGNKPPFAGKMADWDERWLDIRRIDLLANIMKSRLDLAVQKGCDAVEPDNVDAFTNHAETRLPLTGQDQLIYNKWIAKQAHIRGLSVGLKNDIEQLPDLVGDFDWALNEQCFQYQECNNYNIFIAANKAVFGVEYQGRPSRFCRQANASHFFWLKKRKTLDAWRIGCENYR